MTCGECQFYSPKCETCKYVRECEIQHNGHCMLHDDCVGSGDQHMSRMCLVVMDAIRAKDDVIACQKKRLSGICSRLVEVLQGMVTP